jgi:hypothetical protein
VLCDSQQTSEDQTTVANGIMFVGPQYPPFLDRNSGIFQVVLDRLFAFIHQECAEIKAIAVHSLHSIASTCKHTLRDLRFINVISITVDLSRELLAEFYSGCAMIIGAPMSSTFRKTFPPTQPAASG